MNKYKELKVWKKSVDLAVAIYQLTNKFPKDERFGMTAQMRRSSISISSNIAEGAGRNSQKEFKNFLAISNGSVCELETQLLIAQKVRFIDQRDVESVQAELVEIQKMLWALMKSLEK